MRRCSKQGTNTWQSSYGQIVGDVLTLFREEGGKMHWICIRRPDQVADKSEFAEVLELEPVGVASHDEVADVLWREGKMDRA